MTDVTKYECPDHPNAHGQPYADVVECSVCGRAMRLREVPMTEAKQGWAIQSENTLVYWAGLNGKFDKQKPPRIFTSYLQACKELVESAYFASSSARIVEAPVREMTDDECVEWWSKQVLLSIAPALVPPGCFEWRVGQPSTDGRGGCFFIYRGSLFDAIRAAAKKIGA